MKKSLMLSALAALATFAFLPQPVSAAPTALSCTYTDNQNRSATYDIMLNEPEQRVSYHNSASGADFSERAIFTPTAVRYDRFTIDRRTLRFIVTSTATDIEIFHDKPQYVGACRLDKTPRAF